MRLGLRRWAGRATIGRYRLRGSALSIHLRHHVLDDVATLIQTFSQGHYAPPPGARRVLEGLGHPPCAMDLGANIGMFGAWFLSRHPEGRVTAYEADPANARVHALTVGANRARADWEVIAAAAGTRSGDVRFVSGQATNSHLAAEGELAAITVPEHDVLSRAGDFDLLKVDIEGAEWALLADPRFADLGVPVVALEYHPVGCPEPDSGAAASGALEQAGYAVGPGDLVATPGHGMVWGWRTV